MSRVHADSHSVEPQLVGRLACQSCSHSLDHDWLGRNVYYGRTLIGHVSPWRINKLFETKGQLGIVEGVIGFHHG